MTRRLISFPEFAEWAKIVAGGALLPEVVAEEAFVRGLPVGVAVHAGDHVGGNFLRQHFAGFDRAVASGAAYRGRGMAAVAEEHEVGDAVNTPPRDFRLGGQGGEFADFRAVGCNRRVAEHALFALRQSGAFFRLGSRVAIEAGDFRRGVQLVVEVHGLWRNRAGQLFDRRPVAGGGLRGCRNGRREQGGEDEQGRGNERRQRGRRLGQEGGRHCVGYRAGYWAGYLRRLRNWYWVKGEPAPAISTLSTKGTSLRNARSMAAGNCSGRVTRSPSPPKPFMTRS